jgi:hypothetical protein
LQREADLGRTFAGIGIHDHSAYLLGVRRSWTFLHSPERRLRFHPGLAAHSRNFPVQGRAEQSSSECRLLLVSNSWRQ